MEHEHGEAILGHAHHEIQSQAKFWQGGAAQGLLIRFEIEITFTGDLLDPLRGHGIRELHNLPWSAEILQRDGGFDARDLFHFPIGRLEMERDGLVFVGIFGRFIFVSFACPHDSRFETLFLCLHF